MHNTIENTLETTDTAGRAPRAWLHRFVRLLPRWARQMAYAPAIYRLEEMCAEINRDIVSENDFARRERLMKEYLICSSASSFLVNDD